MTSYQTFFLKGILFVALASAIDGNLQIYSQPLFDGFNAYCTSNKDYTGSCTNVENDTSYSCTLIPGSMIDCLTNSGYEFQCLFASQHTPGQATFFCDAQTEEMLYQEAQSGAAFQNVLKNAL